MTAGACIRKTDLQEDVNITGIFPGLKESEAGKVAGEEGRGRGGGRRGTDCACAGLVLSRVQIPISRVRVQESRSTYWHCTAATTVPHYGKPNPVRRYILKSTEHNREKRTNE